MKDILREKLQIIDELKQIDLIGQPIGLLCHGVINTIGLFDLVKVFISDYSGNNLIEKNIIKRLPAHNDRILIYDYVFSCLKNSNYLDRLRTRKILECLIPVLDETYLREFYTYFIRSKYFYEVKSALRVAELIWDEHLQDVILANFYKTSNYMLIPLLSRKLDEEYLVKLAKFIWSKTLSNRIKAPFIKRLRGLPVTSIEFLKDSDPGNFLALLNFTNNIIPDSTLIDCYNRTPESQKPFAIWNLGKLGKWEIIEPSIKEYIANPNESFRGFSNLRFE